MTKQYIKDKKELQKLLRPQKKSDLQRWEYPMLSPLPERPWRPKASWKDMLKMAEAGFKCQNCGTHSSETRLRMIKTYCLCYKCSQIGKYQEDSPAPQE